MLQRYLAGLFTGVSLLSVSSLSHAQCTKDTDCKGDRVCEAGSCVAPAAPLPVAPPPPQATAPLPESEPASRPDLVGAAPPPPPAREPDPPKMQRHSKGMMVGGIVMTSMAPVALFVAMIANLQQTACEGGELFSDRSFDDDCERYDKTIYGGLIVAAGLVGAGIPMIVIGGKKEPVGTASISPWVTPQGGGVGLRVDL
jgi:hypothetical protein